jgi:hypothetical protein
MVLPVHRDAAIIKNFVMVSPQTTIKELLLTLDSKQQQLQAATAQNHGKRLKTLVRVKNFLLKMLINKPSFQLRLQGNIDEA